MGSTAVGELEAGQLSPSPRRPDIPGACQTIPEILEHAAAEWPEREALVGRHARHDYAALHEVSLRASAVLADLGVACGDRVAACLPNQTEIVVAFLGAMHLGAIWVGVPRILAPPEKAHALADCGASVLLGDRETLDAIAPHRSGLPKLRECLHADVDEGDGDGEWERAVARAKAPTAREAVDPFAPAAIAYTSGTTGRPKGVVHSQHNLILPGAVAASQTDPQAPGVRLGVCLPLTILNLQVLGPLVSFQTGGTCVLMDRVDAPGIAEWVREERVQTFSAVPAMIHGLLTHPDVGPDDLVSLTKPGVGGADLPESFRTLYRERFGCDVMIGYGLTEAPTSVTRSDPTAPPIAGSCGTALPQVEIEIRDEDAARLPAGSVGEVCVRAADDGAWAGVWTPMLGYWNKPEASASAVRDEILYTGDLGRLDDDGNLFITDRKNDLILRGGANVYPAEIERVLHEDPRVAACAVLGQPDERLGEVPVAFVQMEGGADADPSALEVALRERCAAELARYKAPTRYVFVDSLPRNSMGKIVKPALRKQLPLAPS
jgi:acyl-CoA synthetase (AMP-forming)/AMP-acid ligase II